MIWSAVLAIIVSSVTAWGATAQSASGDTPVRYVICTAGGTGCEVFARFRNRSECEDLVIKLNETWYPYCEIDGAAVQRLLSAGSAEIEKETPLGKEAARKGFF